MGTSVNQASPKTSGWKAVSICYTHEIPIDRTVTEIWRAASKQDNSLFEQLGSRLVSECVKASYQDLNQRSLATTIQQLNALKQNSVIGEFAKRALTIRALAAPRQESVATILFRQLTGYFISRDIPGFVGPGYRCKTVAEVTRFKDQLANAVAAKVGQIERRENLSSKPWNEAYRIILENLRR
jgi:hypothetical protein